MNIVGIFSVEDGVYIPYRGDAIATAINRIEAADVVVTYNGSIHAGWSDLVELGRFGGRPDAIPLKGMHTDMRTVCWSERIWGNSLNNTYTKHFSSCPDFPDTYEGSNERDVYMTFKLWELWKQGNLKIIDGHEC